MENILIYLSRKYNFYWDDVYKAISNHELVKIEEAKKMSMLNTNHTSIISDLYPTYLTKIFKPPFILFHLGNYDLINNNMISIVGKVTPNNIKVLKFLASNGYVLNFKQCLLDENSVMLLKQNKIPSIIFCEDVTRIKNDPIYKQCLDKKNFLFVSETYMNQKNSSYLEYFINRLFAGSNLPVLVFDESINNDLGLITYLSITKHKTYLYEKQHARVEYNTHIGGIKLNNFNDLKIVFINKN